MKTSFSLTLFLFLYINIESIIQVNAAGACWDIPNPAKPWERVISSTNCGSQPKSLKANNIDGGGGAATPITPENAFQIKFSCVGVTNQTLCSKAETAFKAAGANIAKIVNFNTPLVVNATFANFCKSLGECGGKILGAASAARTIPLQDTDNVIRQYPQALSKQFQLQPRPVWGPFDIQAFFNAEANLFFRGDPQIAPDQFDFEYIITHELIHGLGFASGWNNYFSDQPVALTPLPGFLDSVSNLDQPATFTTFEETAFDKYMVNSKAQGQSPKFMTEYATELNKFAKFGTKFPTVTNLLDTFAASPQFQIAKSLISDAQTPKTFAFQPQNAKSTDDLIFLETNINPFQQGSSISHMDIQSFGKSSDFLEVFNAIRGQSLDQIVASTGGNSPIGKKLQSVLETLGYATANNPNPYKPRLPNGPKLVAATPSPLPVANSKDNKGKAKITSSASVSYLTSSFNILSIFIIAVVLLVV